MSIKKALYDLPSAVRLSDCTEIPETEFEKNGIIMKKVRYYNGDTSIFSITNKTGAPLKIKELVLFKGNLDIPMDTEFYAEGFRMLAQFHGKLNKPELIGSYGNDVEFFNIPQTIFDSGKTLCNNLFNLLPYGRPYVLMGFSSCFKYAGMFRFKDNYLECFMDTEDLTLAPGKTWQMEEFVILEGSDNDRLFEQFGRYINLNHPIMKYPEIPLGWCSFHCCNGVRADQIASQAKAMAERIPELARIQIDAGYAKRGDIFRPNPDCGGDLPTICDMVRETGMEAATYWSPFIFSANEAEGILSRFPDWFLQDERGKPFTFSRETRNGISSRAVLDGTNPNARRYMRNFLSWQHDVCGSRYFKLDFTEYGALPGGVRWDPAMTRVEAYRMAWEELTRDIREDSFILNCNAPFWPALGLSHGNRITNDIKRTWHHFSMNALECFYRNWMHSVLWINDPDGVMLERKSHPHRDENGNIVYLYANDITDAEIEFHKAFIIACGGMVMGGDLLDEMSDENIEVMRKMLSVRGEAARFDYSKEGGREFKIGRKNINNGKLICVFNWDDEEAEISVPLSRRGDEDPACTGSYEVSDFWSGEIVGRYDLDDKIIVQVPIHGAKVFKLSLV